MLVSGCTNNTSGEQKYREAETLWMKGDYQDAKDIYKHFIQKYQQSELYDDAIFKLGEIYYLNLNNDQQAIYYFSSLVYANIESEYKFPAHKYLAQIYEYSLADYDKAIIEYQRLIDNYHTDEYDDESQFRIAYCYFRKGNYYQAIVELDNLIEKYPDSPFIDYTYYQKSNIYYILGDCPKAKRGYAEIIQQFPDSKYIMDAKVGIAECFDEEGHLDKALEVLQELEETYNDPALLQTKIQGLKKRLTKQ